MLPKETRMPNRAAHAKHAAPLTAEQKFVEALRAERDVLEVQADALQDRVNAIDDLINTFQSTEPDLKGTGYFQKPAASKPAATAPAIVRKAAHAPAPAEEPVKGKKRQMSAESRKRLSESLRQKWAERKAAVADKKPSQPAQADTGTPKAEPYKPTLVEGAGEAMTGREGELSNLEMVHQIMTNHQGKTWKLEDLAAEFEKVYGVAPVKSLDQMLYRRAAAGKTYYKTDDGQFGLIAHRTQATPVGEVPATAIA